MVLYVTIADADIESLKSIHSFISICTTYLTKIVWSELRKIVSFFDKKMINRF